MVVCPIYQLSSRTSQIYQQAVTRSVCIFSYAHLAVLVHYAEMSNRDKAMQLIHTVFKTINTMNPSKDAITYWQIINRLILDYDEKINDFWQKEKLASIESINISKAEDLQFIVSEREKIMRYSKEQAIREVLKLSKINNKERVIKSVVDNGLLSWV